MKQQNRTQDSFPPLKGVRALELAEIWAGPYCVAYWLIWELK